MRCDKCVYWESLKGLGREDNGLGTCGLTKTEDGAKVMPETMAWAEDAESYFSVLVTHAEFGCVQYEEKKRNL